MCCEHAVVIYVHVLMKDIQSLMFQLHFLSGVWNSLGGNNEYDEMRLFPQRPMECQRSSKNSACWLMRELRARSARHADGAAALPRPRFLSSSSIFSTCSQRWQQQGVQETSPWTSQNSATRRSPNYLAVKAKTILSWPAMEVLPQLVSRVHQPVESVSPQVVSGDWKLIIFLSFQVLLTLKLARSRRRRRWLSWKKRRKTLKTNWQRSSRNWGRSVWEKLCVLQSFSCFSVTLTTLD